MEMRISFLEPMIARSPPRLSNGDRLGLSGRDSHPQYVKATYEMLTGKRNCTTSLAKDDLVCAISYIADMLKAPLAAERLLDDIEKEPAVLAENSYLFPLSHDEYIAHRGIRHAKVKNYMLFYTVNEDARTITIIRMLYARRDWLQLLGALSL